MKVVYLKDLVSVKNLVLVFLAFNFFVFTLLLFKNPFSERNLISNLEPYPDTIHYITPARSFISGDGFHIEREGRVFKPTVPFLYSFTLVPLFLVNNDPRVFYFANVLMAFAGAAFFYIFLTRISSNRFIPPVVLFFYLTNYFIYWYPTLAMAENLGLFLFNLGLFLLTGKVSTKNSITASILSVAFYATKYANFTLSAVFALSFFLKIISGIKFKKNKLTQFLKSSQFKQLIIFAGSSALSLGVFFGLEYLIRGDGIFSKIQYLMEPLVGGAKDPSALKVTNPWFSYSYFDKNFRLYLDSLLGNQMRFLWDFTPLLPKYLSVISLAGLIAGLFIKTYRFVSFYLILFIIIPILFLSTFYAADARYIYHVIPSLFGGLAVFLSLIFSFLEKLRLQRIFLIGLAVLFIFYFGTNMIRLKYQIVLNLKYSETPWNYLAAKTFSEYFKNHPGNEKPILITAMNPYYLDFFSNDQYKQLPLSTEQEFTNNNETVWGPDDYSDFIKMYSKYLNENRLVFVSNAGLGNQPFMHRDFNLIKENFEIREVVKGCVDTCNVYQLTGIK